MRRDIRPEPHKCRVAKDAAEKFLRTEPQGQTAWCWVFKTPTGGVAVDVTFCPWCGEKLRREARYGVATVTRGTGVSSPPSGEGTRNYRTEFLSDPCCVLCSSKGPFHTETEVRKRTSGVYSWDDVCIKCRDRMAGRVADAKLTETPDA